jgi:putative FmdB family regulatory protein
MPIYAYRCGACGHAQDVLQKMSDPVLTVCPACGQAAYAKQLTAAGFQLKGSGWYVTDFRGGKTDGKPDAKHCRQVRRRQQTRREGRRHAGPGTRCSCTHACVGQLNGHPSTARS